MLPFKKVLCPTDFSEPAQAGLDAAVEMALHFGAALHLVHVVPALPTPKADRNYTFAVPEYESALHADALEKLEADREPTWHDGRPPRVHHRARRSAAARS